MQPADPPPAIEATAQSSAPPGWTQSELGQRLARFNPTTGAANPTLLTHVLLACAITVGGVVLYASTIFTIYKLSGDWDVCPQEAGSPALTSATGQPTTKSDRTTQDRPAKTPVRQESNGALPELDHINAGIEELQGSILPSQKQRLKSQLRQLQEAQQNACEIGIFFFANRNAALTVSTAAGMLAIASLAFVSKNGWERSNNAIINIGITSGLILFTTWTFSQLYGQGKNYETQRAKVALASNLLNAMASATANRIAINMDPKIDSSDRAAPKMLALNNSEAMSALIQYLDTQLEVINNIDFTGDASFAEESVQRIGSLLKMPETAPR